MNLNSGTSLSKVSGEPSLASCGMFLRFRRWRKTSVLSQWDFPMRCLGLRTVLSANPLDWGYSGPVPCADFLKGRGEKKGTLARVLAPKMAVYHVLTSQGGSLVCFANQEGTLACFFGSQEGTLAHVLAPRRALWRMFWLPGGHFSAHFSTIGPQRGGGWLPPLPRLVHITALGCW